MKITIGSDHAGVELKNYLVKWLTQEEYTVADVGTHTTESVDYPHFAHAVAMAVAQNPTSLGVLICGSGNGVCMTANKHADIRAAVAWDPQIAALARQHNNANVLCLPARFIDNEKAKNILDAWLKASFEGGRHLRRVNQISG